MAQEIITLEDLQNFRLQLLEDLKGLLHQPNHSQKQWLKSSEVRKMLGILSRHIAKPHSKLEGLYKPIENLEQRLTTSSTRLSKYHQSSLWQRYWTAIAVGMISALLTTLIYHLI
jgi:hypothetical protein